jgi:glutamate/tyrosine decarboxylase-like PLP-dependent enzyme
LTFEELRASLAEPLAAPGPSEWTSTGAAALAWLAERDAELADSDLGTSISPAEFDALIRRPAPEQGREFREVLTDFGEHVAPFAKRIDHPRFLAFIASAPVVPAVIGELLCAGCNFFAGNWANGAGATQVELIVLDWFRDWLGMPATTAGVLTTGGSEANLTALAVARHLLAFDDRPRAVLYTSDQRHASIDRAMMLLGFRRDQISTIAAGDGLHLSPRAVIKTVHQDRLVGRMPWAVVANAGATNTGAIDPLPELAELRSAEGLWLHVDAAYGWSAMLVPEGRAAITGIDQADSVALDPHKWFAQPYDAGCVLIRDGRRLEHTFAMHADYLRDVAAEAGEVNLADRGPALTRRFRALKIWMSVQTLGLDWFRQLVARCFRLAEYAEHCLIDAGFHVVVPRQLGIVCFRHEPPGLNEDALDQHNTKVNDAVTASRRAAVSSTRIGGRVTLRLCFVNWRTTAADVDMIIALLAKAAQS